MQQYGYYSLAWRFTGNPGCPEHGIRLVTRCYLCDSPLPLPLGYDNARIGECPLCGGDLTHAPAKSLDYDSYEKALEFDNRISLLLLPHKDVSRKPIFETTRNKNIAISSSIFRVNWDTDLPEQREYATFSNYYEKKLISKNNFCVRLLFTLYWLSTSQTEAMLSYLAFRDDPRFLFRGIEETKPYLLGKKMYCRKITKANGTLPSEFDLVPIDPNLSQLWGIIFDMRTTLQELPMEVFYDKSIYEKVIEILISKLSRWVNQIDMLRSSKAEKKDSLDTKHMGIPKLKLRLLAIGNRSFNLKELSEFLFEIRLYVNTLAYDLYHNPELFKFTVEEMFMDLSKLISQIKTQNSSLIFLEEENRRQ